MQSSIVSFLYSFKKFEVKVAFDFLLVTKTHKQAKQGYIFSLAVREVTIGLN